MSCSNDTNSSFSSPLPQKKDLLVNETNEENKLIEASQDQGKKVEQLLDDGSSCVDELHGFMSPLFSSIHTHMEPARLSQEDSPLGVEAVGEVTECEIISNESTTKKGLFDCEEDDGEIPKLRQDILHVCGLNRPGPSPCIHWPENEIINKTWCLSCNSQIRRCPTCFWSNDKNFYRHPCKKHKK